MYNHQKALQKFVFFKQILFRLKIYLFYVEIRGDYRYCIKFYGVNCMICSNKTLIMKISENMY